MVVRTSDGKTHVFPPGTVLVGKTNDFVVVPPGMRTPELLQGRTPDYVAP